MSDEYRYFKVALSSIKAVVGINGGIDVKTIDCTNQEACYHSNVLERGKCPRYCMVLVEAKHYIHGKSKTRANIREIPTSEVLRENTVLV